MKTYKTYEQVNDMNDCIKRRIIIQAKQIDEPFRVDSIEGNYKQGKAGDYLMRGIEGELYICDKDVYEKTYDFLNNSNKDHSMQSSIASQIEGGGCGLKN